MARACMRERERVGTARSALKLALRRTAHAHDAQTAARRAASARLLLSPRREGHAARGAEARGWALLPAEQARATTSRLY